jgi:hypothetical protein
MRFRSLLVHNFFCIPHHQYRLTDHLWSVISSGGTCLPMHTLAAVEHVTQDIRDLQVFISGRAGAGSHSDKSGPDEGQAAAAAYIVASII